jgi:hypothetical protein
MCMCAYVCEHTYIHIYVLYVRMCVSFIHVYIFIPQSVEDSQHRLLEQVMAFQKMMACKVDRVEIPLLHAAAEKMQSFLGVRACVCVCERVCVCVCVCVCERECVYVCV